MTPGKLCVAVFLSAMPAVAAAQPSVSVDVGVDLGADTYDTVAPGDSVESVDVFYDQLSPYGVWVDEPDVGRVFIPDTRDYVPYTIGHWQYTNLGFVWISTEPYAWATTHYGRWAYSTYYGRWYWLPDTGWGPAWVEWRQTDTDFGWAPLAPEVVVRAGWQPPAESWHYCSAEHILDANVTRYYEPRERVVEIHRRARPVEHYARISNVRVAVGPPTATLREHHVAVHRVRVEPRTVGRWTPAEAHAQIARATEHRAAFEVQNQHRIEANTRIHAAHAKVLETHPQIRAQVTARVPAGGRPAEPSRVPPAGAEHNGRPEPGRTAPDHRANEPARVEPGRPGEPERGAPRPPAERTPAHEPRPPVEHAPAHEPRPPVEHAPAHEPRPPVEHAPTPRAPEQHGDPHGREQRPPEQHGREQAPPEQRSHEQAPPTPPVNRAPEQRQPPEPKPPEPAHRAPEPRAPEPRAPEHARPQPQRTEPPHGAERKEPDRRAPDRKDEH